jgi:hypothetical protein
MNPFQHGVVVTGDDFCPRPGLVKELRGHMVSRQNCLIRGGRRMGKTSAVLEALRREKKAEHLMINCWGKTSLAGFIEAIYEAFLLHQSRKGMSLEGIMKTFAHLRPKASVDPRTGTPSFSIDLAERDRVAPRSLEAVLEPIGREGKKGSLVVVFDEFQSLMQLKESEAVMATLRGAIQLQKKVTYFYLGSIRSEMDELFNNPKQPFFKSAASVTVGPIERGVYGEYLARRFQWGKRKLTDEALRLVFDLAREVTGDVQQLCASIWNCTDRNSVIREDTVHAGLSRIHQSEHETNSRIIDLLTPGQVRVLIGLARVGGRQPTSKEFLSASGLRQPSSVSKAVGRLDREGLIYRDAEGYQFFSPFFRTWLLAQDIQP